MKPYCSEEVLSWLKQNAHVYQTYDPTELPRLLGALPENYVPTRLHIPLSYMGKARLKNQLKQ